MTAPEVVRFKHCKKMAGHLKVRDVVMVRDSVAGRLYSAVSGWHREPGADEMLVFLVNGETLTLRTFAYVTVRIPR